MSSLPADLIIWALLFIGVVFCGIGLMGLMLFPDTRSRMFTAFRATAIGLGAVAFAVITYAYTLFVTTGIERVHGPDPPHAVSRVRAGCRDLDDVRDYPGKDRMETRRNLPGRHRPDRNPVQKTGNNLL